MSEKTLNDVAFYAKNENEIQKLTDWMLIDNKNTLAELKAGRGDPSQIWVDPKWDEVPKTARTHEEAIASLEKGIARGEESNDMTRGANFARENAAQLHDLAVIEAHLAGVAINVQQPLVIGHKVEVHTPDQE